MKVYVYCYNEWEVWASRKAAMDFYEEGARCCDGCEAERYSNIYWGLKDGYECVTDSGNAWDGNRPKDVRVYCSRKNGSICRRPLP